MRAERDELRRRDARMRGQVEGLKERAQGAEAAEAMSKMLGEVGGLGVRAQRSGLKRETQEELCSYALQCLESLLRHAYLVDCAAVTCS